ncbi:MAG: 23S rRNA (guanosine(2251)-2'-O)-methyltransferase RlmB [Smithellaceae bacterium]
MNDSKRSAEIIYGINPIKTLLDKDACPLQKVMIASGRGGTAAQEIVRMARQKKIPVELLSRQSLDAIVQRTDHQGVVALRKSFAYADLEKIIENRHPSMPHGLIVILDGIMDPQNLGSIIRSAHCLGANGIVIPTDRAAGITPAAIKASAGSADQLPVARVTNVSQLMDELKAKGFWVFGAEACGGTDLRELDFNCPVALVMGSEDKGMRPLVRKKCDFLLTIPMVANFDSFNVSVAAGIIQYEIQCRRRSR